MNNIDTTNSMIIKLTKGDKIFCKSQLISATELCKHVGDQILDNKHIVLTNSKNTNYKFYLKTYNQIKDCYASSLDSISIKKYNSSFELLDSVKRVRIKNEYPLNLTETIPN